MKDAVGRTLEIFGTRFEVVGVVPGGFDFPDQVSLWAPAELGRQSEGRSSHNWSVVGRLHDGLSPQDAFLELDPMTRRLVATAGQDEAREYLATGAVVTSLQEELVGDTSQPLCLLMGAAAFVLLVGSGLLIRSFSAVLSVEGGFDGGDAEHPPGVRIFPRRQSATGRRRVPSRRCRLCGGQSGRLRGPGYNPPPGPDLR